MSNTYRLIVCIDIDADSLKEAYVKMRDAIVGDAPGVAGWETSDEWYGPSEDGANTNSDGSAGDPAELQTAIIASMKDKGILL